MGLHALTLVLVPAFLLAGWWQYHVALGGNDLSWVYTVEWPFFALYALYVWWRLIHDESTPFDRLWAAKQRIAADAEGTPLNQIPGWATDKEISRAVISASLEANRPPPLLGTRRSALKAHPRARISAAGERSEPGAPPASLPAPLPRPSFPLGAPTVREAEEQVVSAEHTEAPKRGIDPPGGSEGAVIDAEVLEVKVFVDEELDAYNRYLAELSWRDPPKQWVSGRTQRRRRGPAGEKGGPRAPYSGAPAVTTGKAASLPPGPPPRSGPPPS